MKRLRAILRRLAEFSDTFEFSLEEIAFKIEGIIVKSATEIRRLDDEIMNDGSFFSWGMAQKSSSTLHKLPRIRGAGKQKAHAQIGNIDPLIKTANRNNPIQKAGGCIP